MNKTFNKYISGVDCVDKTLLVLSAVSGSVSIASFAFVIGAPVGIRSANLSLVFSFSHRIAKSY